MTYHFMDLFMANPSIESNPQSHVFPVDQPPENTQWWTFRSECSDLLRPEEGQSTLTETFDKTNLSFTCWNRRTQPILYSSGYARKMAARRTYLVQKSFSLPMRTILSPNRTVSVRTWIQATK